METPKLIGDDYIIVCVSGNQECHTTSYNFSEIIEMARRMKEDIIIQLQG